MFVGVVTQLDTQGRLWCTRLRRAIDCQEEVPVKAKRKPISGVPSTEDLWHTTSTLDAQICRRLMGGHHHGGPSGAEAPQQRCVTPLCTYFLTPETQRQAKDAKEAMLPRNQPSDLGERWLAATVTVGQQG